MSSPLSNSGPLANGLYPIIRRLRRPLIIRDDDAPPPPASPPTQLEQSEEPLSYGKSSSPGRKEKREAAATAIWKA
jgi:hypothetical protein